MLTASRPPVSFGFTLNRNRAAMTRATAPAAHGRRGRCHSGVIVTFRGINGLSTESVLNLALVPAIRDDPLCDVLPLGVGARRIETPLGPLGLVLGEACERILASQDRCDAVFHCPAVKTLPNSASSLPRWTAASLCAAALLLSFLDGALGLVCSSCVPAVSQVSHYHHQQDKDGYRNPHSVPYPYGLVRRVLRWIWGSSWRLLSLSFFFIVDALTLFFREGQASGFSSWGLWFLARLWFISLRLERRLAFFIKRATPFSSPSHKVALLLPQGSAQHRKKFRVPALAWIAATQVGRRNLTSSQMGPLGIELKKQLTLEAKKRHAYGSG